MRGKFALFLGFLLLLGVFSTSVTAPSTKTIDGDPTDWTGTPGLDNTWVVSSGEGIWSDMAFDDTGNGSIIYPNCTHSGPPPIVDSAGAPWTGPPTEALAYTDKFGGTSIEPYWYKHGGMVDLREFRITADSSFLYILVRFENMGNTQIAKEWGGDNCGFGSKALAQVYIDKDRVSGSGRTNATMDGNFEFDPAAAWEAVIDISDDFGQNLPRVVLADGTIYNHTTDSYCHGDPDIYPSAIEMKVPFSEIGDPRGQTWRFVVVVGGTDGGNYRQVVDASVQSWYQLFRFCGGEGGSGWDVPFGKDSNIIDMAFTASQAQQEALLNSFSSLVKINRFIDIKFDTDGDVLSGQMPLGGEIGPLDKLALMTPWIILAVAVTATAVSAVFYSKKRTQKPL